KSGGAGDVHLLIGTERVNRAQRGRVGVDCESVGYGAGGRGTVIRPVLNLVADPGQGSAGDGGRQKSAIKDRDVGREVAGGGRDHRGGGRREDRRIRAAGVHSVVGVERRLGDQGRGATCRKSGAAGNQDRETRGSNDRAGRLGGSCGER